jgi:hypothetical protein
MRTWFCQRGLHAVTPPERPFTFFEARSINFVIVVYSVCMHVNVDLHRTNFRDHGGSHGQESEEGKEGKEGKEDSQEEVAHSLKI